jgi:hypothetical protein
MGCPVPRVETSGVAVPLAIGEVFTTIWEFQQLITEQLIDFVRAAVTHAGGISHLRRIAALAEVCRGPAAVVPEHRTPRAPCSPQWRGGVRADAANRGKADEISRRAVEALGRTTIVQDVIADLAEAIGRNATTKIQISGVLYAAR